MYVPRAAAAKVLRFCHPLGLLLDVRSVLDDIRIMLQRMPFVFANGVIRLVLLALACATHRAHPANFPPLIMRMPFAPGLSGSHIMTQCMYTADEA